MIKVESANMLLDMLDKWNLKEIESGLQINFQYEFEQFLSLYEKFENEGYINYDPSKNDKDEKNNL